jgi:translation initiation factor 2 gamma subunit (eIF-2gamma)
MGSGVSASFVTTAFRSEAERRNIEAPGMNIGRVGMVASSISVIAEAICGIAFARSRQQLSPDVSAFPR